MKRRVPLAIVALLLVVAAGQPHAISGSIVISQVYGGGGNAGATFRNDFIELFNRGGSAVNVNGMSVQYAAAAGTTWQVTTLGNVTLQPGQYFLVQEAVGAGGTQNLPTPDATGAIAMAGTAGKVALVSGIAALSGSCPTAGVVDFVGFGTTASCFEGAGPTPAPSNTLSVSRAANGCTETDNNTADFTAGAPAPRNTSSVFAPCTGTTNPSGTGSANPSSVLPGGASLLTVNVTPGSSPVSTGLTLAADLSAIGGSATQPFTDDGTGGDVMAGDNIFSFQATVSGTTTPGAKLLPATIADGQSRTGGASIPLTVAAPPPVTLRISDIQGPGSVSPYAGSYRRHPRHRHGPALERVLHAVDSRGRGRRCGNLRGPLRLHVGCTGGCGGRRRHRHRPRPGIRPERGSISAAPHRDQCADDGHGEFPPEIRCRRR